MDIPKSWSFEGSAVAEFIDDHIPSELPWYPMALDLCCFLAKCHLKEDDKIVDLGCSTGAVTRHLSDTIKERRLSCVSIDESAAMVNGFSGPGEVKSGDMRDINIIPEFNVATLMLSLMFTGAGEREGYLKSLEGKCLPGGAIIIVDKIIVQGSYLGRNLGRITTKLKMDSGVLAENIIKKDLSLCGIQRPTKESVFFNSGYVKWFQVGEFAGYIKEID